MNTPRYTVAVRSLCEFTAKTGDIDLRFTPSPSAQEGMLGHQTVAARRPPHYETEIALEATFGCLLVRGRADGYDAELNQLEEIKTHRGDLARVPDNHRALHWAQLYLYGAMLCEARNLASLTVALVYFDVSIQQETVFREQMTRDELQAIFSEHCARFLLWAEQELQHRETRDEALRALTFPYPFRTGQRPLAEQVYRTFDRGHALLAQAPTGIGKTLGTLFPALKALPTQPLDKLFFLTAKTPGRQLALDAVQTLSEHSEAMPLRTLELVARGKRCEHPGKACHGDACPLARGFYDRLPAARQAAVEAGFLDQSCLREIALTHEVCPYYLGQELTRWCDVIVGDYNYYFDFNALLHGLTQQNSWRVGLLIDEAHNLVDRARGMYSVTLPQARLEALLHDVPTALRRPLAGVLHQWQRLNAQHWSQDAERDEEQDARYQVLNEPPEEFINALQGAVYAISEHRNAHPTQQHAALLDFYFEASKFCRVAELADDCFMTDLTLARGQPTRLDDPDGLQGDLCLRNLVPASLLATRFDTAHASVLFSATLSPDRYYRDLLGLPTDTPWVDIPAPFSASQLQVSIVRCSTRFRHRARSVKPIVDLIARQFADRPGNYLAFFSSFDYLEQVATALHRRHPDIPLAKQSRRMNEPERQAFLDRFTLRSQQVGFAVLGGAFGEGIDLPGSRLIGTFIATLGMPQLNPVNEQMRERLQRLFGNSAPGSDIGHDYTYHYPGLQKVVQAAGRVIRTPQDTGVVYLIDDRFSHPATRALLPAWWAL